MFDFIVARALWDLLEEVFDVHASNFESIATRWLCNKKFMHFNVVSSAVMWGLWLNRHNLVFNKTTWVNMKQVLRPVFFLLRDWKKPFKDLESGKKCSVHGPAAGQFESSVMPHSGVRCPSFGWISS
jgi:hypothetical protein